MKKYIDVSKWQGVIDWTKAKGNIDGVMIRAGYGQNNIDAKFVENIKACNANGIPCGVYWFSYATTEAAAKQEANYCLNAVKPYKLELPIAFDFEYDSINYANKQGITITKTLASKLVHAFCGVIEQAGYYAMNYTNKDYLKNYFDSSVLKYDLWLANWATAPDFSKPPQTCGIWQYSSKGIVPGISGNVDMNAAYKDYQTLIRAKGMNGLQPAPTKPWYADAQAWAIKQGITDGTKPDEPATRAQVWQMLYTLHK